MKKNIIITDENGIYVGTTYPRRAKGLIKNGRALFVDDCTIRLPTKTKPFDDKLNQSEVKQMNYIYFNAREWSSEQTQYQNGNRFHQPSYNNHFSIERSFINDFDGDLVESLMFGGWDESYVKVNSKHFLLPSNTESCFVFWLNGGENDRNNEICELQITFFDNPNDSYIYKLNRNFIKPLLHKQGWELYSIHFVTPSYQQTDVDTVFSFVAGNAPMALKPAKEPSFYSDWKDEPDEFAKFRPQRHNIVFEDGWPSINMYGGNKYSTQVLRSRYGNNEYSTTQVPISYDGNQHSTQTIHNSYGGNQHFTHVFHTKKNKDTLCQQSLSKQEHENQTEVQEELIELLEELQDRHTELIEQQQELSQQLADLQVHYQELLNRSLVSQEEKLNLEVSFNKIAKGIQNSSPLLALSTQFSCITDLISNPNVPIEAPQSALNGAETQLNSIEEIYNHTEKMLDDLENLLDEIEDREEPR